jgi:hypothetical protein
VSTSVAVKMTSVAEPFGDAIFMLCVEGEAERTGRVFVVLENASNTSRVMYCPAASVARVLNA